MLHRGIRMIPSSGEREKNLSISSVGVYNSVAEGKASQVISKRTGPVAHCPPSSETANDMSIVWWHWVCHWVSS